MPDSMRQQLEKDSLPPPCGLPNHRRDDRRRGPNRCGKDTRSFGLSENIAFVPEERRKAGRRRADVGWCAWCAYNDSQKNYSDAVVAWQKVIGELTRDCDAALLLHRQAEAEIQERIQQCIALEGYLQDARWSAESEAKWRQSAEAENQRLQAEVTDGGRQLAEADATIRTLKQAGYEETQRANRHYSEFKNLEYEAQRLREALEELCKAARPFANPDYAPDLTKIVCWLELRKAVEKAEAAIAGKPCTK